MSSNLIRKNKSPSAIDTASVAAIEHNPQSGAKKILAAGPEFKKSGTDDFVSGLDLSAGKQFMPGSIIYFYNNSGTIAWAAFGLLANPSAPTGFTNGVPLLPNQWTILSVGTNNWVRTSAATVGCYEIVDYANAAIVES